MSIQFNEAIFSHIKNENLEQVLQESFEFTLKFLSESHESAVVVPHLQRPACDDILPDIGLGAVQSLKSYLERYGKHKSRSTGPRYFGFVTGGVTPAALAADWLVSTFDQNVATERHSIAAAIENRTLQWITELLNLPAGQFHGLFTTGATAANLIGLSTAREWCGEQRGLHYARDGFPGADTVCVLGGSPHSSIGKVMGILGLGYDRVCRVGTLPGREAVDPDALESALSQCKAPDKIVVASAGTVDTGDFDNLPRLAALCRAYGAWLHVDGAFGAFTRCSPDYAHLTAGLELADSITMDAHKWLNVPHDCGVALTRHPLTNERAFSVEAPYVPKDGVMPAFMNRGVEQSRRFRALPVFISLAAYGRQGYRMIVERNCAFAKSIAEWMRSTGLFECVAETKLNIVAFKGKWPQANQEESQILDAEFVKRLNMSGQCFVTPSTYKNQKIIRFAVSNWQTDTRDFAIVTDALSICHHETLMAKPIQDKMIG